MNPRNSFVLRAVAPPCARSRQSAAVALHHGLLTRAQLHGMEGSMARIAAMLRQLLEAGSLDPPSRLMAAMIAARADEQLTVIRALLERGLHVD